MLRKQYPTIQANSHMRVTCVHMCARLLVLTKHMNHILNLLENILACTHETPFLNSRLRITGIRAMAYSLLTIKISTSQQPHMCPKQHHSTQLPWSSQRMIVSETCLCKAPYMKYMDILKFSAKFKYLKYIYGYVLACPTLNPTSSKKKKRKL